MNVEHCHTVIRTAHTAVDDALNPLIDAEGGDPAAAFLVAGGAVKFLGSILAFLQMSGKDPAHHRKLIIDMMDETQKQIVDQAKATLQ
jgi:hypothetical protein